MILTLLTFGERLENHYQACFAILTFIKDPTIQKVVVVTDRPEFYQLFDNNIDIVKIDNTTLKQWEGQYQFFWRVKIKALETIQQRYPQQNLLYIDSDTFLARNLNELEKKLSQGQTIMHIFEHQLCDKGSSTLAKMYRSLRGKSFCNITIQAETQMWNAGVIGLPAQYAEECIALALKLCDEMCSTDCPRRLIEQFAFSIALNHIYPLQSCDTTIGHYWGNKNEWNNNIANFFVNAHLKKLNLSDCVQQLAQQDWQQTPLIKKQRRINFKLQNLINRFFPDKNIEYFK